MAVAPDVVLVVESAMGSLGFLDRTRTALRNGRLRLPSLTWGRLEPPPHQLPDVPAVVAALRRLDRELDAGDGVGHFNRMYLQVTELVGERLREGFFVDDRFIERLDIVFAHLYLDAVEGDRKGRALPQCWEPVFTSRSLPLVPIQFAVAGMNAHINHDLAVAVVTTCRQLGLNPGSRGVREDYVKVNVLLAEVHEQVRRSFIDGLLRDVDREMSPLLNLVGSWSIGRARDAAWVNAEVLWKLRHSPQLQEEFRAGLCRAVGLTGRTLLVRLPEPV